ncbi:MAG: hypothetical protein M1819_000984 [Sarea resinae]|nr:MAG: hypothetical protein M1819_000984 [Sarea resinae]
MAAVQNLSVVLSGPRRLTYEDRPIPILTPTSVLIRISHVGICGSDVHFYLHGGIGPYISKDPIVIGHEAAGTVSAIGEQVKSLSIGDRVCLEPGVPCRRCVRCKEGKYHLCKDMIFAGSPPYSGTMSKFYALEEDFCYKLPESVSLEEGALVEPMSVAVHIVKQADIRPGQSVVIFGAGTVGLLCCAVAREFGAKTVVVVDVIQARLDFAANFAATGTYLASKERAPAAGVAAEMIKKHALGSGADVVLDASGAEPSIQAGIHVARAGGTFVQGGMGRSHIDFPIMQACMKELTIKGSFRYGTGDYPLAVDLLTSGKIPVKELITAQVPFTEAEKGIKLVQEGKGIKTMIIGLED